jgi:foldase protein PrsA
MKPTRVVVSVLIALVVVVSAACGGSDQSVPSGAVAVVDGTPITKADLDAMVTIAKKSYTNQKRAFPKAGTAEFQSVQTQLVATLVQRAEYDVVADDLRLTVTDKEIQDRIDQIKQQVFGGSQAKLDAQVKLQGYNTETLHDSIRAALLSNKIAEAVTKDAKVTDAEIAKYYNAHKTEAPIFTAEHRDVRHILVHTKAEADTIYDKLAAGADFATLVNQYTLDEQSKATGGKMTIERGQTVAPFEKAAFSLTTNQVSHPVKTQFGYHVIQPVSNLRPERTLSLKDAKARIKELVLNQKKNDALNAWAADKKKSLDAKVVYATGYAPPATATDTTTTG